MDLGLESKVVLVTGSSRGIGKAIATAFLKEGAKVAVTGRKKSTLKATMDDLREVSGETQTLAFAGDLTNATTIAQCIEQIISKWEKLDIVVANVGSGRSITGWKVEQNEWDRVFRLNLWGSLSVIRQVVPLMIKNGNGAIVVISSIAGLEAIGAPMAYAAAKSALNTACKSLSKNLAVYNIRVNIVAPGNIFFQGGTWDEKQKENPQTVTRYLDSSVPMKRFGMPEEIAKVVVFIASNCASFMTGSCVVVDGGQTYAI